MSYHLYACGCFIVGWNTVPTVPGRLSYTVIVAILWPIFTPLSLYGIFVHVKKALS